ncbi:MAG: pyruvate kinase [Candidatus Omnitrophica bacterium]|jgi:pyruvate kinase|nr:pyruvate kinase [Candidatus Omnitrophota bacterium]
MVKTKIVCTLGPSSQNTTTLRKMMLAGMDIARLNFSHGTHKEHLFRLDLIRRLNRLYRRRIRILQDLEGYRIRIGKFDSKKKFIKLNKRQTIYLTNNYHNVSDEVIPLDYDGSLRDIKKGSFIYIDDGNITLKVKSVSKSQIQTEIITPGILKENKGVNIPEIKFKFKGLTNKDQRDLKFGIEHKVDFIAQSFVRTFKDIINLRAFLANNNFDTLLIAKIESKEGVRNIDKIIEVSDGIMIARGDMGVTLPIYEVPLIQKMIIKKCLQQRKIVITATQMLESMTENKRPTRAEVSDVANAVLDGSTHLMLSGETAVGTYPIEAVKMMNDIIKFTESIFNKEGDYEFKRNYREKQ